MPKETPTTKSVKKDNAINFNGQQKVKVKGKKSLILISHYLDPVDEFLLAFFVEEALNNF